MTIWHKAGLYLGMLLIIVGGMMYIPDWAHRQHEKSIALSRASSPVWLEADNSKQRNQAYTACMHRTTFDQIGCLSEAYKQFPDRNWKQVAADNAKRGQ